MANRAVARETFVALRHEISRIEDRLAERLEAQDESPPSPKGVLATGVKRFDAILGGGIPSAGLTEIQAASTSNVSATVGFTLALARLFIDRTSLPFLWVGMTGSFREAGYPYPPGLLILHSVDPYRLLVAQAEKLTDVLWIAEQAASLEGFCAIVFETCGASAKLDLTATRRLHRRALDAGRPLFLIRHSTSVEPTAAAFRLIVRSAPAGLRRIFGKPLYGSIGPPAFAVEVNKNRTAPPAEFILEWNADARAIEERASQDSVALVPAAQHRASVAAEAGTLLAFSTPRQSVTNVDQPSGEEYRAHRRAG